MGRANVLRCRKRLCRLEPLVLAVPGCAGAARAGADALADSGPRAVVPVGGADDGLCVAGRRVRVPALRGGDHRLPLLLLSQWQRDSEHAQRDRDKHNDTVTRATDISSSTTGMTVTT